MQKVAPQLAGPGLCEFTRTHIHITPGGKHRDTQHTERNSPLRTVSARWQSLGNDRMSARLCACFYAIITTADIIEFCARCCPRHTSTPQQSRYKPYLTDGETEAQGPNHLPQDHTAGRWQRWDSNAGSPAPKPAPDVTVLGC